MGRKEWALPYRSPEPDDPAGRRRVRALRAAAYVLVTAVFVVSVVQFQSGTVKALRKAEKFDRKHPDWTPALGRAMGENRPAGHKGAIGRWRCAVRQLWEGRNIYAFVPEDYTKVDTRPASAAESPELRGIVWMHPNMPATVLLLTPFGYLSAPWAALAYNVLKLAALAAAVLMAARLAGHGERRVADWVVLLGVLWTAMGLVGDIRHGNTNVFVLAAVVGHLWLFRRGRDVLAGLPLAAAICLKMTPALFCVYWLYQRNWRLLASTVGSFVLLAVVVPAAALGPGRYGTLAGTWYRNMIAPGLAKGSWYPEHINQSMSGVVSRYFLAGKNGDIYWGPDDDPRYLGRKHGWITLAALPDAATRWVLRAGQVLLVAVAAWAIGWRTLPRDDGRRALHYTLVLLGMMLLNQRTWNHHAAVLLPAGVAVWQAVAFGRTGRGTRIASLVMLAGAGLLHWLVRGELLAGVGRLFGADAAAGERLADVAKAYGPTFYYFLLLFAVAGACSVALRTKAEPFAPRRQTLAE